MITVLSKNAIEEKKFPIYKVVSSMPTDGAPPTKNAFNGFLALCIRDEDFPHFRSYSYIIHQQSHYCNILNMRHDMGICMNPVNSVRGRTLQRRMFQAHLEENEYD
ncbi:hypothetical protein TNCT_428031 [Trichonephila clavata]|uniref:Uncharacterized protein n=1 Tax=Trichonephila clavata TaxID=2740835 RepID=A0A8X6FE81_TRICU|nr:hypothetical protein TNCT_428031 [Trichonephila clavata]